jgi:hypothetical protein
MATRWFSKDELQQFPEAQLRHTLAKLRLEDWLAGKSAPMEVITPWGL